MRYFMNNITPTKLTKWLKEVGLSQRQLAKMMGMAPEAVTNWKRRKQISYRAQIEIARIMEKHGKSVK